MMDQAEKLRQMVISKKNQNNSSSMFRVITISSGKGGVGKTNIVVNLALCLQRKGLRVAILDADFGMANVDILLGVKTNYNVYDMLYENKNIDEIIASTRYGLKIIPGGSGIMELGQLDEDKRKKLQNEFTKIQDIDVLLVDTGAGMSKAVLGFIEIADDVIIVTNSEPTALTDAYSLIKVIIKNNINKNIGLVVNRARNLKEGMDTYNKLNKTIDAFLNTKIKFLGYLVEDNKVGNAVREQKPFIEIYPKSEIALCIQKIANIIIGEKEKEKSKSIVEYFNKLFKVIGG